MRDLPTRLTAFGTTTLLSLGMAASAYAQTAPLSVDAQATPTVAQTHSGSANKSGTAADPMHTYIIRFNEDALAAYDGSIPGLAATSPLVTYSERLNVNTPESQAYLQHLTAEHAAFAQRCDALLGRHAQMRGDYKNVFNGMAVDLTPAEAQALANDPYVLSVSKEKYETPMSDVGPATIGAPVIWTGGGDWSGPASSGDGVVIAILDTGINHDHPSFADIGGDGFDHTNPLGSGNYLPGSYCDTVDPTFCNDKLIGAWAFVPLADDPTSPEDSDGHGSHTAGTSAGNVLFSAPVNAPTTNIYRDISGVAPHANIIAYDVCVESCPQTALLGALEQVIIDASNLPKGIHGLNYSISGGNDPYNDPVELAFLNATAAGIFVSASAGNSGPGAGTVAHNSPWVASTAALTHGRRIDNSLTGFSSDGTALSDILGAGFTAAFGPAPIVHASDYPTSNGTQNDTDPGQCLDPFPAGTFNGEIVVCDRGSIARVAKGANVMAGGAGGFVLANTAAQGESISADPHVLPGVHVGFTDGEALRTWLASESNTVATISGTTVTIDDTAADIMAGFSSRGANQAIDVLKPDIGAPGVSILATVNSDATSTSPELGFLSGTSMSSPHNAGAGALLNFLTFWSPYQIRSAMMMTAKRAEFIRKEDGVTPADPFDTGAGRVDLSKVMDVGLVLDETTANFLAADPAAGGDPKTLNLASMMDSACVGSCSWTRTVKNITGRTMTWDLHVDGPAGVEFSTSPKSITIGVWGEESFTVSANTAIAPAGWVFGDLKLVPRDPNLPALHMPIAVQAAQSTAPGTFTNTVDRARVFEGQPLTYTLQATNGQMSGPVTINDPLPPNTEFIPGSVTETVNNGTTISPAAYDAATNSVTWTGTLNQGSLAVSASPSPYGFIPLAALGVAPFATPTDGDEGGVTLNVPAFEYNGETHTQVLWSVNGTIEVGAESGSPIGFSPRPLPDSAAPNNLLAPFWTDFDMSTAGTWYVANLSDGVNSWTVYEWSEVPLWGLPTFQYSFQVWVQTTGAGGIWFTYDRLDFAPLPFAVIGAENADGTTGFSYWANGAGTPAEVGTDLAVSAVPGGQATVSFRTRTVGCKRLPEASVIVNTAFLENDGDTERAIAVTQCSRRSGGGF